MTVIRNTALMTFLFIAATVVFGQDQKPKAPSEDAGSKTYEVKPGKFRINLKLSGTFESVTAHEVKAATKQLTSLTVDKAVARGTTVRKGQPIIWFATDKVDRQLKEAEYSLRLAELAIRDAELGKKQLEGTQKLDKALAERTRRNAQQAYDNFVKTDQQRRELSAEFSLKNSQASLENALEELKQLDRMYKEDELTEESEEIVLKRARQIVENAKFRHQGTLITTQRSLKQSIPDELEQQKDALARQELAFDKAVKNLAISAERTAIELDRQKFNFAKQESDLAELRADRKQLVIRAPMDGVVYYGPIVGGRLGDGKQVPKFAKGSTVKNSQVLMTIINPKALQVRVDLEEKQLQHIRASAKGFAMPTAFPDRRLNAKVKTLSFIPHAANKFDCAISVQLTNDQPPVVPGMTCSVEFTVYQKDDALTVPDEAVFGVEQNKPYVYVQSGKEAKQRFVTIGKKSGGKTEVVAGLKAGEKILREKP